MSDPAAGLLTAYDTALRASAALATAMGGEVRVYSVAPTNKPMPYLLIGEDQVIGDDDECADASEIASTIHLWARSEPPGVHNAQAQARAMAAAVREALATQLTISGHDTDDWVFEDARYLNDPDGSVHGILTFRYLVTATA